MKVGSYSSEMDDARSGELRGFENQDGNQSYVLLSDGSTIITIFGERVEMRIKCKDLLKPTEVEEFYKQVLELEHYRAGRDPLPDEEIYDFEVTVGRRKFFVRISKKALTDFPYVTKAMSAGSRKALGSSLSALGGLDID